MRPLSTRARRLLHMLAGAQLARRQVRLRYVETDAARSDRTAEILALAFDAPRWLVAAW